MTNDELKATAEYLSSLPQREDMSFESLARKAKNIADAYLARLAADDLGDSIDDAFKARIAELEEWRASRLAADEQEGAEPIDWNEAEDQHFANGIRVEFWRDSKTVAIIQTEDTVDGVEDSCITTRIKTRGQLRKLIESLKGGAQ